MDRVACPKCGYRVGLGTASEPGRCPKCNEPLMLTVELRADDIRRAAEAQKSKSTDEE